MFSKKSSAPRWGVYAAHSVVTLLFTTTAGAEPWTLESAVQRVMEVAPEMRAAEASIQAIQGELTQARSWPNPTIEVRTDDKLGQEDGRGGTDFTQFALSQPLPLRRVPRERAVAESRLAGAEENRRLRKLELEFAAAQAFHGLQLAQGKLEVAQTRLKETEGYPGTAGKRDRLARYLAPLERARLAILREEAAQDVVAAEREREQALIAFRARLALPADTTAETTPLAEPPAPPALDTLEKNLETHPLLVAARREQEAAELGVAAARSQRFADPALNLFRERDILADGRGNVTGIGLSVQVPLWNTNPGVVAKARAEVLRARTDHEIAAREARVRLNQAYTELTHTRVQGQRLRASLLEPGQRLNELTRRSFHAGEVNLLALIDAANAYYDARSRYLELLARAQLAEAELRLAVGQSVAGEREVQP